MMDDSIIGTEVDGYRIQEVLGRGGMGVVYRAEDLALSRDVALKQIDPSLASDEVFLRRFRSEARTLARIDSPYIVSVYALRQTERGLLIVMEYVEGGTLWDRLQGGPMDWRDALPLIEQMLQALEHAHGAEVIHRDIKPRNIMLSQSGRVKVTDFGLAKVHRPDSDETVTQGVHGTLNYMSPEQVQGSAELDHRSDLYSLGMTIYEVLAGELPFDEDASEFTKMRMIVEEELPRPDEVRPQVPAGMSSLVMKALEKEPDDRFRSAAVMREAFQSFGEKHGSDARSSPPPEDPETTAPSWKRLVGLTVLVLLSAGAGGWLYSDLLSLDLLFPDDGTPPTPPETALSVTTRTPGATVFVDGSRRGTTPLADTVRGEVAHLRVQRAGYVSLDTVARLDGKQSVSLDLALAREATPLRIQAEPDAEVVLDGEAAGRTPLRRSVRKGTIRVRAERQGYHPVDTLLRLAETDQVRLRLQLDRKEPEEQNGTLTLSAAPSGTVFVDGEPRSSGSSIQVPTGEEHRVRFRRQTHERDTTLTVEAEETKTLTCYFKHRVVVRSDPVWASIYIDGENTEEDTPKQWELGPGTYGVEVRVNRGKWEVTGGEYRRTIGGERQPRQEFPGSVKTITLEPAFQREIHVIDFQLSKRDS